MTQLSTLFTIVTFFTPLADAAYLQSQGHGARATAMGEPASGLSAQGVYGIIYNPAELCRASNAEVSMDYAQLLLGLSDGSSMSDSYVAASLPWRGYEGSRRGIGLAWSRFGLQSGVPMAQNESAVKELFSEEVVYGVYSALLSRDLMGGEVQWGLAAKLINRSFGDVPSNADAYDNNGNSLGAGDPVLTRRRAMSALSADLGLGWRHGEEWSFGALLADFPEPNLALDSADTDKLQRSLRLSGAWQPGSLLGFAATLEAKKRLAGNPDRRFTFGAERYVATSQFGLFGIRGALGVGGRSWRNMTAGLTWKSNALSIDYGYTLPTQNIVRLKGSHRVSLTIRFGGPPPEEEILNLFRKEQQAREKAEKQIEDFARKLDNLLAAVATQPGPASSLALDAAQPSQSWINRLPGFEPTAPAAQQASVEPTVKPSAPPVDVSNSVSPDPSFAQLSKVNRQSSVPPEDPFKPIWAAYERHKGRAASRIERMEALRRISDQYPDRPELKREWDILRKEMQNERKDFEKIWDNYKKLSEMKASPALLLQSLGRMAKRFEGSGVDLAEIYREMDRVRIKQ